jgi:HAD superfamily hydrolase (TIGR01490 family)
MENNNKEIIAIFDFDKTITDRHTFIRFFRFISGSNKFYLAAITLLPEIIKYKRGIISLMNLREKAIKKIFTGLPEEKYQNYSKTFVSKCINNWLLEEAIERIMWHKSNNHKLILLSNSPEDYLSEWATQFKFDYVIGSKFEIKNGMLTGKISGEHCFGIEKVKRLKAILGDTKQYFIYGYGDSEGDIDFLNMSDEPFYQYFNLKKIYKMNVKRNDYFEAYKAWSPEKYTPQTNDVRCNILQYAILAANSHNIQPWRLDLQKENVVYLYIDASRLLRHTDPDLRHIYLSQGTFIETFIIAASHFGYRCKVDLLPAGIPSVEKPDEYPVASITLKKDGTVVEDDLFPSITKRCSSHAIFKKKEISKEQLEQLLLSNHFKNQGFVMCFFDEAQMKRQISDLLTKAMAIQCNTQGPHSETIKMIRFRNKHLYSLKDGFSFRDLGVTGFKLKLAERFATPKMANSSFFKANVAKSIKIMSETAQAFGVIYAPHDTRENQIISGQIFCNVHLKVTQLGLSFQPMDHVFQKYRELHEIEKAMCRLVQYGHLDLVPMAIFRTGYSDYTYHTPRRPVEDLLIK